MLQTHEIHLRIGTKVLVEQLSWQMQAGQLWCVIGRNGTGKSTLLRTLAGLRQPDAGTVQLHGKRIEDWPVGELALQRSYLPQGNSDAFGYRVIDAVLIARSPYQAGQYWDSEQDMESALSALNVMDALNLAERDIRSLSGGERQRVAMAAVLAQDAPVMLLDEPTTALDLGHQVEVMRLLKQLCKESSKAIVMVSHDVNLARNAASHALLLMGNGRWLAGPIEEIMTACTLSDCLDYPIDVIQHGDRLVYFPKEASSADERSNVGQIKGNQK